MAEEQPEAESSVVDLVMGTHERLKRQQISFEPPGHEDVSPQFKVMFDRCQQMGIAVESDSGSRPAWVFYGLGVFSEPECEAGSLWALVDAIIESDWRRFGGRGE